MPDAEAKTGVKPGVPDVTVTWLVGVLLEALATGVTLTTPGVFCDHVRGPTTPVMSTPLLKALASRVLTWFVDRQPATGVNGTTQAGGITCRPGQAGGGEFTGTSSIWMLSIGGCTKTSVGALLTPTAEAVTWTTPVACAVQVVNAVSHRPAQPTPFGATFRIFVSLD